MRLLHITLIILFVLCWPALALSDRMEEGCWKMIQACTHGVCDNLNWSREMGICPEITDKGNGSEIRYRIVR
jgi:hypothetical protein